jgi:hypothetical protein
VLFLDGRVRNRDVGEQGLGVGSAAFLHR